MSSPIDQPPDPLPAVDGGRSVFSPAPRHVLVVDDDPGVRDVLSQALLGAGYRVSCAVDGEAGWDALCADSFDVLITDNDMPGLSGVELLRGGGAREAVCVDRPRRKRARPPHAS